MRKAINEKLASFDPNAPLVYSVPAFAKRIGVSTRSAYRVLRRQEVKVVRIGSRTLIPSAEIDALLDRNTGDFLGSR